METLRVIGAVLSVCSVLLLSHWIVTAMFFPKRSVARFKNLDRWSSYAYYISVLCSWSWFAYLGFYGLLFWFPTTWGGVDADGSFTSARITLSVVLTFGAICIIVAMEGYAEMKVENGSLRARLSGANKLVDSLHDIPRVLEGIKGADDESRPPIEPDDKLMLSHFGARLDHGIKRIVHQALLDEQRRSGEIEVAAKRQAAEEAKRLENGVKRLDVERRLAAISSVLPAASENIINDIASLTSDSVIVDADRWKSCWSSLKGCIGPAVEVGSAARSALRIVDLSPLLGKLRGVTVEPSTTVTGTYTGDSHGGATEFTAVISGTAIPLLNAVRFTDDLEGLAAAFYFAHVLPTMGRFWHGCRDYDYRFFCSKHALVEWLITSGPQRLTDESLKGLTSPCGLRARKEGSKFELAMLGGGPATVEDFSIDLVGGQITATRREKVFDSDARIFY